MNLRRLTMNHSISSLFFGVFIHINYSFSTTLKQHWDTSKTLHQNMKHLGLAFDSNKATPGLARTKKLKKKDVRISLFIYLFVYFQIFNQDIASSSNERVCMS